MNDIRTRISSVAGRICTWLIALVMIQGCMPAMPAAVPTLSESEMSLLIQQTADAAFVQTLEAAPTLTPFPTLTLTPIDTPTAEPTGTPFTFILPTPTSMQRIGFFRVKHDSQLEIYDFKSRTAQWTRTHTPEVFPLFGIPKDGAGTVRTPISGAWEGYMNELNGNDEKRLNYLKADNTALFNDAGFPQMESLVMGGNVITLDAIQGEWGLVHTFEYNKVGSVEEQTYRTQPDLVHKFVIVVWNRKTKSTFWTNTPRGAIYYPFVSSRPVWIRMEYLEPFPILPMTVKVKVEQEVRKEPSLDAELFGETVSVGESLNITKYQLAGSQVWGRLPGGKWIALFLYTNQGPTYFTTWSMETLPPPP